MAIIADSGAVYGLYDRLLAELKKNWVDRSVTVAAQLTGPMLAVVYRATSVSEWYGAMIFSQPPLRAAQKTPYVFATGYRAATLACGARLL